MYLFHSVFLCQLHAHAYAIVLAEIAFCGFPIQCLHNLPMTMFVMSQSFISLPSFMFVIAAVSEIHDLNQNDEV